MDVILKFDRVYYQKYDTSRINIENGILVLKEKCKILKIDKMKYSYQKAVVELDQPDSRNLMKLWETRVKEYLKDEGIPPITIVYGVMYIPSYS